MGIRNEYAKIATASIRKSHNPSWGFVTIKQDGLAKEDISLITPHGDS